MGQIWVQFDGPAKLSRAQATDAAKHSREITLIIESDGYRDIVW